MAGVPPVFTITLASPNTKFPNQIPQLLLQAYPALTLDIHAGASQLPNASKDADEAYIALSHRREIPAAIIEYTKGHSLALRAEYTATLCTVGGNQTLAERVQATLLGQDQLLGVQNQIAQVLQVQQQILDELQRQGGQITQSLALQVKLSAQGMNTRIHRLNRLVLEGVSLIPCYPLKEIDGDGTALAQVAIPNPDPIWNFPPGGIPLNTPPPFLGQLPNDPIHGPSPTAAMIKASIIFYNHNFGIIPTDNANIKANKFRKFLLGELP